MMNLIILGPQGSGKGTQAKFLAEKFSLEHIDVGLALRQVAEDDTPLGKELHRIMYEEKGLVSDEEIMGVLQEKLKNILSVKGIIIDGAPRRMGQVDLVETVLRNSGREISKLIYLDVSEEESIDRIAKRYNCDVCHKGYFLGDDIEDPVKGCPLCGGKIVQRKDDTPEGVRKRLQIFHKETYPVVEHYREKGMVVEADGMNKKGAVFAEILEKIKT